MTLSQLANILLAAFAVVSLVGAIVLQALLQEARREA